MGEELAHSIINQLKTMKTKTYKFTVEILIAIIIMTFFSHGLTNY
jgi:hypothetical protein